jgi:hypothetical protein
VFPNHNAIAMQVNDIYWLHLSGHFVFATILCIFPQLTYTWILPLTIVSHYAGEVFSNQWIRNSEGIIHLTRIFLHICIAQNISQYSKINTNKNAYVYSIYKGGVILCF